MSRRSWSKIAVFVVLGVSLACNRGVAGGSADGAEVFEEACSRCHGPNGRPEPGMVASLGVKNLTEPELQHKLSDEEMRKQILEGSENNKMPPFKGALTDAQVTAVIAHVRSLKKK